MNFLMGFSRRKLIQYEIRIRTESLEPNFRIRRDSHHGLSTFLVCPDLSLPWYGKDPMRERRGVRRQSDGRVQKGEINVKGHLDLAQPKGNEDFLHPPPLFQRGKYNRGKIGRENSLPRTHPIFYLGKTNAISSWSLSSTQIQTNYKKKYIRFPF